MNQGIALGAPDIYPVSDSLRRALSPVRMDICAFVGVTPRGPCRVPVEPSDCDEGSVYVEADSVRHRSVPVAVDSWDQYVTLFGGYEGPGRMPYAVASLLTRWATRIHRAHRA